MKENNARQIVNVILVPMAENAADLFTKALPNDVFARPRVAQRIGRLLSRI